MIIYFLKLKSKVYEKDWNSHFIIFRLLNCRCKSQSGTCEKNNTYIQPFKQQSKFYSFTLLKEKIKEQHFNFDNVSVSETLKLPYQWRCYDVTYYTDCGTVWGGDLCVYSNSNILSEEQWWNGWRRKNFEHCGYWLDY